MNNIQSIPQSNKLNFSWVDKVLLIPAIFLPLLTGLGTSVANIISFYELIVLLYYINSDKFLLITPVVYLFFSQLLLVGTTLSLFNVYAILCTVKFFVNYRSINISKHKTGVIICLICAFASCVAFIHLSMWNGIILLLQTMSLLYTAMVLKDNPCIENLFRKIFIIVCINTAVYGVLYRNVRGNYEFTDELLQYNVRYCGTSSDPNYMAFYYCVGITFLLFMREIKQSVKLIGFVILFIATALTGSLTGLITIAVIFAIFIFINKEVSVSRKLLSICLAVAAIIFFITYIFSDTLSIPILDTYRDRILEKLGYITISGNLSDATSGRTELPLRYIKYLFDQNILRILFGGFQINAFGLSGEAFDLIGHAPHNAYIDILMTNGVVGLVIFLYAVLSNVWRHWKLFRKGNYEELANVALIISSCVFIMGLSVYPSAQYLYFFLI